MKDLKNSIMIWLKGAMFLLIGIVSAVLLIVESPTLRCGLLLGISIWSFCRAYYFAFYVIEHYVDPSYRFSGLWSFCHYLFRRRTNSKARS